tara:strand:- start:647 stop:1219 length:573 start_codon:yes stop_codon:yes gene_type:complete
MFSGIIQGLGTINKIESNDLFIETSLDLSECIIGSSISCNGICLTATSIKKIDNQHHIFSVNLSEETKNRIAEMGKLINIEKSIKVGDEISGHFVYGHVDCVTEIIKIEKLNSSWDFEFKRNQQMKKYVVEKGSVAINGISLTISNISSNSFSVSIIPHTFESTNLKISKVKDFVNIEFDILARYILNND